MTCDCDCDYWPEDWEPDPRHSRYDVSVVTPWVEHLELVDDYFEAIEMGGVRAEVIIVDNASEPVLELHGPNTRVLRNLTNKGFSGGSNTGLAHASAEVVAFINNDIIAHKEGWLRDLVQATEPGVLTGARLVNPEHAQVDGMSMPYLDGWCLAGMRADFLELGGWDESLEEPSYYSDNVLCARARAAGFVLREVSTGLVHKGGQTSQANGFLLPSTIANQKIYQALVRELLANVE